MTDKLATPRSMTAPDPRLRQPGKIATRTVSRPTGAAGRNNRPTVRTA